MAWTIHHGDCREVMATLDAESVDAIVSDPPYGLSFMGKGWDHGVPGVEFWTEAMRVAKPGAHLLAFGGTRTYHRLACAIEDAGWEIRDCVMWVYGSGFPKSHDVSKAIDKAAGAEREVVGTRSMNTGVASLGGNANNDGPTTDTFRDARLGKSYDITITAPATDAARQWSGWGTALKPAHEPIIVARKPLVGTVAENVLRYGTGAINVDGCRVAGGFRPLIESTASLPPKNALGDSLNGSRCAGTTNAGRWPANLIHDGSDEVVGLFPSNVKGGTWNRTAGARHFNNDGEPTDYQTSGSDSSSGSAARFFYCAKASKADRDEGCEGISGRFAPTMGNGIGGKEHDPETATPKRNHHPTVKPTALMRYLCRLVTPPGGIVLDPFTGSGSTGKGAVLEGFRFIGIEREAEYVEIAKARIAAVESGPGPLFEAG
jgi:DNA modification methylase